MKPPASQSASFSAALADAAPLEAPTDLITSFSVTLHGVPILEVTDPVPISAQSFLDDIVLAGDPTQSYQALVALLDDDTTVTGNAAPNGIEVGAGNDTVAAGAGDDTVLKWSSGDLVYDGGAGSDTLSFAAEFGSSFPNPFVQKLVVDLSTGTGQNPYGGTLTLTSVENINGTSASDSITGSNAANIIGDGTVETAGDIIDARGGDDTIGFFSFAGFDLTLPGAQIDGGAGSDTLVFQYDFAGNVLDLTNQANNAGMFARSTFTSFEHFVVGSDFATSSGSLTFIGDATAQYLEVNQGLLTIDLGGGADTLKLARASTTDPVTANGGAGTDRLIFTAAAAVNVLDLEAPVSNTFPFANGTFTNFEIFELTLDDSNPSLNFQLDFRGDATASTVIGGDDNDTFRGRGGNDILEGGKGGDLYIHTPGDGNDTIIEDGLAAVTGAAGESQTDTLRLVGLDPADVALTRAGNDLRVTLVGTGEVITITDHFLGLAKGIEQIELTGTTFDRQDIIDNLVGGTPDASPTVSGIIASSFFEDSGIRTVNLLTGATDTDGDTLHLANVNGLVPGITLVGDTVEVDTNHAEFQSVRGGSFINDIRVTYDVVDGEGGAVGQRAQIAIFGIDDPAAIGGDTTGVVVKDVGTATGGLLSVVDVDATEAHFVLQTDVPTAYGSFSLTDDEEAGFWSYTLDNDNPAVQALTAGQSLTDIIPVQTLDGTTANVTVTIHGALPGRSQDFNGDGNSDILFQHTSGAIGIWELNGTDVIGGLGTLVGSNPGTSWKAIESGDINGDGNSDILFQHTSGAIGIWELNGTDVIGGLGTLVGQNPGPTWHVKATGDFNGDGNSDILFQHDSGLVSLWELNGTDVIGGAGSLVGQNPGPDWDVKATGDFNGDGKSDVLFQHDSGLVSLWELNGTDVIGGASSLVGQNPGPDWDVKATGDFNGDGRSDVLFQHDSGLVSLWEMNGTNIIGGAGTLVGPNPGPNWDVKATGDYNGDGTSDILFQHTSGAVSLWELDGTSVIGGAGTIVGAPDSWLVV